MKALIMFKFLLNFFKLQKRPKYGVSFDSSIELDSIPRIYPEIDEIFRLDSNNREFIISGVDKLHERIIVQELPYGKCYEIDYELFENIFMPTNTKLEDISQKD